MFNGKFEHEKIEILNRCIPSLKSIGIREATQEISDLRKEKALLFEKYQKILTKEKYFQLNNDFQKEELKHLQSQERRHKNKTNHTPNPNPSNSSIHTTQEHITKHTDYATIPKAKKREKNKARRRKKKEISNIMVEESYNSSQPADKEDITKISWNGKNFKTLK